MNKKAIAILGAIFLLIVGTLGFLIYSKYYGAKPASPPAVLSQTPTATETPVNVNGGGLNNNPTQQSNNPSQGPAVAQLTGDQVVSPVLFYNGAGIAYFDHQGQLFQVAIDDSASPLQLTGKKNLSLPIKAGVTKILWPNLGDDFIAEMASGSVTAWSYYNSQTGAYVDLPPQIISLDWMPGGKQILYVWLANGKANLSISDPDTKNWKKISDMWEVDDRISISPDGLNILYYRQGSTDAANAINLTTPDGKLWKGLVTAGYNYGVLWSPDSQKFLFGKKNPATQQYQLWYYNLLTGEVRNLNLATTPDKAVWDSSGSIIYAAVPAAGTANGNQLTTDSFVKLDTASGQTKNYPVSTPAIDGRDLFLSKDGGKLFFRNAQDGGLYYLDLGQ